MIALARDAVVAVLGAVLIGAGTVLATLRRRRAHHEAAAPRT